MKIPIRIDDTRKFVSKFAAAVTAQTDVGKGCIARNGEQGLFRMLHKIMPQVGWNMGFGFLRASI